MARRLGSDHHHVEILTRGNLAVMDVEAVRERQGRALADVGLDLFPIHHRDVLVGHEHHHQVGALDRGGDVRHLEPGLLGLVPGGAAGTQAHRHLHPGIVQVLRMRVPLRTVADDGDLLALDERQIGVFLVVNLHAILPKP